MKKHLLVLVAAVATTAVLIGCGGSNGDITGTQDPRILGDWIATDISLDGISDTCPGTVVVGEPDNQDSLSCTDRITNFSEDGKIRSGDRVDDFFFGGGLLTVYTNPRVTIQVTFEEGDSVMRYLFIQNGREARVRFERPVLE